MRNIKDYINQGNYAILCSSVEEFNDIVKLINKIKTTTPILAYNKSTFYTISLNNISNIIGGGTEKSYPNYTIYPANDFLEEEPKFEVGKWYKNKNSENLYRNISRNEIIWSRGHFNENYSVKETFENWKLLTDLSEIQHLLPDNHPDKISKLIIFPSEGCVYDDVKNLSNLAKYLISRPLNSPDNTVPKSDSIGIGWNTTSCWWLKTTNSGKTKYKLSDLETFLPKTEVIPEYVEYIDTKYKGKIVKVEDWCCGSYCKVVFYNEIKEQPFKHLVKPSTKVEYDAQNEPKQLTIDDLVENEIYKIFYGEWGDYIFKYQLFGKECWLNTRNLNYIKPSSLPNLRPHNGFYEYKLATPEEKKWLNTCITQDKFIPKEDLHLYDDSGLLIPAQKCEECNDTERVMRAKLYPSGHTEVWEDCEKCQEKEETMFKKGDYIVNLKREHSQFKIDHIFKQKYNLERISPEIDCMGSTCNSWLAIRYINQSDWRYATSEEIEEYNRLNKPFDVNSLIKKVKKSLIGRYVKRISYNSYSSYEIPKIGEYDIIEKEDNAFYFLKKFKSIEKDLLLNDFELMPIRFEPSNEEWIPKVGDWYILEQYCSSYWFKGKLFQIGSISNGFIHPMVNNKPDLSASIMITGTFKDCRPALPHEIPINSDCIIYNGQDISKGLEVSQYYEFDGNNYSKEIHIPVINKRKIEKQLITIESPIHLELNLTKIKSKQIQTIKI